jgi:hypothetical protein
MELNSKLVLLVISLPLLLLGCGGGGSNPQSSTTSITGTVTPPAPPTAVTGLPFIGYAAATSATNMLLPPNYSYSSYASIVQTTEYKMDANVNPALKATAVTIYPVDPYAPIALSTGALAYTGDATLGQLTEITTTSSLLYARISALLSYYSSTTIGGIPAVGYIYSGTTTPVLTYLIPYSGAINPSGYTYQTFGNWSGWSPGGLNETWFSLGIPTAPNSLPTSGTASYAGQLEGTFLDSNTRDPADAVATVTFSADFTNRTIALATTATTALSANSATGIAPTGKPGLNFAGSLAYASGSNSVTGVITTTNGMSGNATCRFYGPAIATATASKAVNSPPEISCTFAVYAAGVGAMEGALGAK